MKPSKDWTEDDVLQLIDQKVKESSDLEYKACPALKKDGFVYDRKTKKYKKRGKPQSKEKMMEAISKDVSSFANAAGGTVVYRVIEDNHIPLEIDKYPFDPHEISKEWLENVIDSNIKKKIDGIKINQIELNNTKPGKVIYAVCIPQSLQGAHQANDYKYYQRRNFKSEPMEDYQVRDVMNRFNFPIIEAQVHFADLEIDDNQHRYAIGLTLSNVGNVTAVNFGIDILFPNFFWDAKDFNRLLTVPGFFKGRLHKDEDDYLKMCYRNFGLNYVLLPSDEIRILDASRTNRIIYFINNKNLDFTHLYKIKWTIFADNMPPKREEHLVYNKF